MDRQQVHQRVIDELGRILVDKDPIKDDALMTTLILDKQDFDKFFSDLQSEFGIVVPQRLQSKLSDIPDSDDYRELTLKGFVDVIVSEMRDQSALKR
ncbi:hypothetical protein ABQX22_08655 [Xanthomonas sp. WHRI 1810A]|jgi:hypothetical protein|uniref:hypothetical protein n=1 Tax=Xanthomonas sp. WHRI 1810A TaxID=3161565 RepID=UPI0032E90594